MPVTGKMFMRLVAGASVALLAACGGSSTSNTTNVVTTAPSVNALQDHTARSTRLDGFFNSAFTAMPTTGSAEYEGSAAMQLFTNPENIALVGDARLTANFKDKSLSGRLNNFVGTDRLGNEIKTTGRLSVSGVIGVDRPNMAEVSVGGTISGGGTQVDVVTSNFDMDFKGAPIRGIKGGGTISTAIVSGVGSSGIIAIAAEAK